MGELHFSQGDGEITFCGAIEMAGWLHLKVDLNQGAWRSTDQEPDLQASPIVRPTNDYLIFEAYRSTEQGKQYYLDVPHRLSSGLPQRHRISHQVRIYRAQAYAILGTGACQGHISGVVDIPTLATCGYPTDIFDFDVMRARPDRPSYALERGPRCRCRGANDVLPGDGARAAVAALASAGPAHVLGEETDARLRLSL